MAVSVSSISWLWVIEALASSNQVDISLLNDVVSRAPKFSDNMGKNAREIVGLRCLEAMFGPRNRITNDLPYESDSKIGLNFSESCEVVLNRILCEMSTSNVTMAGPDLLKWDIFPFIVHKRACLPRCALEQLKDTILKGAHPFSAFLREKGGLKVGYQGDHRDTVDGGDPNALSSRFDGSGTNHQIEEASRDLTALAPERNEFMEEVSANEILLPSKRNRNDLSNGNLGRQFHELSVENSDPHLDAKKSRQGSSYAFQSVEQDVVLSHGNEWLEDPCGGTKNFQDEGGFDQNIFAVAAEADAECCVEPKTSNVPTSDGTQQHSGDTFQLEKPIGASADGTHQKIIGNEAENNVEQCCEEETSSDSDGYHNEKDDVASKKLNFISSQCTFSHDSYAASDWTEQNLCMKCNKDGQLLHCSGRGCPLVVHEHCLGSLARFDDRGNFYCPFCEYSLAISEYLEAKKKASLARKELATFIGMGFEQRRKKLSKRFSREKEQNHPRKSGDVDFLGKSYGDEHLREEGNGQENDNEEHVNVDNRQTEDNIYDKQEAGPSAPCVDENLSHGGEETTVFSGTCHVFSEEKREGEKIVKECQYAMGLEGQENQVPVYGKCNGGNSSCRDAETILVSWKHAEADIHQEVLPEEVTDPPQEPGCALNNGAEDMSEDENEKSVVSHYSIRFRNPEKRYTFPSIPLLRRKKVTWTAEEEEILKEGVQRFSNVEDRNIPWKKILEFGGSVFQKGRTTIDLKDKWRNICKGSPKSK